MVKTTKKRPATKRATKKPAAKRPRQQQAESIPLADLREQCLAAGVPPVLWANCVDGGAPVAYRIARNHREFADYFGASIRTVESWARNGILDNAKIPSDDDRHPAYDINRVCVALLQTKHYARKRSNREVPAQARLEMAMCDTLRRLVPILAQISCPTLTRFVIEGAIERIVDVADGLVPLPQIPGGTRDNTTAAAEAALMSFRQMLEYDAARDERDVA